MNETEKKILKNVEEHGCHVNSVFDPEGIEPNFTYSVGIHATRHKPEIIVVGLTHELAHYIVNAYYDRVTSGDLFEIGEYFQGFLEGFEITFGEVSRSNIKEYMTSSCWFNKTEFSALQLIYPNTSGTWPWDPEANEAFKNMQPCLAEENKW